MTSRKSTKEWKKLYIIACFKALSLLFEQGADIFILFWDPLVSALVLDVSQVLVIFSAPGGTYRDFRLLPLA